MSEEMISELQNIKVPVFNIERFAIHDGPGIRTVVFLQGCPLHCPWCANPESQTIGAKLMHLSAKCVGCSRCVSICTEGAITISRSKAHFDRKKCTACGKCAEVCPNGCMRISGEWMSLFDIMEQILRDRDYYNDSGGGVTFSGGEALVHFHSLVPLLSELRNAGINIAFETCGQVAPDIMRGASEYAELFLFDVKSADKEKLAEVTGGNLDLIFGNLRLFADICPEKVTVRIPVIPGFNLENDGIYDILKLVSHMNIRRVELLPYHTLGRTKYEQLGIEYKGVDSPLDRNKLKEFLKIGDNFGIEINIG